MTRQARPVPSRSSHDSTEFQLQVDAAKRATANLLSAVLAARKATADEVVRGALEQIAGDIQYAGRRLLAAEKWGA